MAYSCHSACFELDVLSKQASSPAYISQMLPNHFYGLQGNTLTVAAATVCISTLTVMISFDDCTLLTAMKYCSSFSIIHSLNGRHQIPTEVLTSGFCKYCLSNTTSGQSFLFSTTKHKYLYMVLSVQYSLNCVL